MINCAKLSAAIQDATRHADLLRLREIRSDLLETRSQANFLLRATEDGIETVESKAHLPVREILAELARDDEIIDWTDFFRHNEPSFVCEAILSSFRNYGDNVTFLGRALFLICVFEDDDIALTCLTRLYNKYNERKFMQIVHSAGECARIEHDSREWNCTWLPNYNRIFIIYIKYFDGVGLTQARRFWDGGDVLIGFIAAEMYRSGYSLTDCLHNNEEGIELLLDILCSSPEPLEQADIRKLAVYALRHFDLRQEYFESVHDDFHCYLLLNAHGEGVLPQNHNLQHYLEKLGHCEEEV